jgi:hypothetical protein
MLNSFFRKGLYGFLAIGTLCAVIISSVLVYLNFYYFLIPHQEKWLSVPADFDFSTRVPIVESSTGSIDNKNSSSTTPYYAAQIDTVALRARLNPKFRYKVVLHLELTRNTFNKDLGNFMVALSPSSSSSSDRTVRKPAILPYRSPIIEVMHDLLGCGLYLTGFWQQTSMVRVPLTDYFDPADFAVSSQSAYSEASIQKGKQPQPLRLLIDQRVHIANANLSFEMVLQGLRYWIHLLKLPFFIVFTGFIASVEIGFAIVVAYLVVYIFGASPDKLASPLASSKNNNVKIKVEREDSPPLVKIKSEPLDEDDEDDEGQRTAVPESPRTSPILSDTTTAVQSRSASSM